MVSSDLSSYGSLSSPSRLSRSPLMNVPFELSKSLMEIYRAQNNHEHLTYSNPPLQKKIKMGDVPSQLSSHTSARYLAEPGDAANVASVQGRARLVLRTCRRRIGTSMRPMLSSPTLLSPLPNHK
jgi:hypothetical protein